MSGKPSPVSARAAVFGVGLIWLLCVAMLIYVGHANIGPMQFLDPDDAMRLVEVRDWLGGQSWFDVSQYRAFPPHGAPMHWSRLVDIPIAGIIMVFTPLAGQGIAERIALVAVPMVTLLLLMIGVYALTFRVSGGKRGVGLVAAVMLAISIGILLQFKVLRIDHHGWQIVAGTWASFVLVGIKGSDPRRGAIMGAIMATALNVAIEGLPITVAIGGILGLRYLRRGEEWATLVAYVASLAGVGTLLLFAMLGWPAALVGWCDSFSPAYLVPVGAAGIALLPGRLVPVQERLWGRLAVLGFAGVVGAATYACFSRQCLGGPFASLDPLVYQIWYLSVNEGLPLWKQDSTLQIILPIPSMLGLVATLCAIRSDAPERRDGWIMLLMLQVTAFAVSIAVMRAMGMAHSLALPGNAWLFLCAFRNARQCKTAIARVVLSACCFFLTAPAMEVLATAFVSTPPAKVQRADEKASANRLRCAIHGKLLGLDALPPTVLFAPLDISAHLLVNTHHSIIGTGHHRNRAGMKTVISAFISPAEQARAIIATTPARYVVYCAGENEIGKYMKKGPHGLMADLVHKRIPSWLERVPMRKGEQIIVYRIVQPKP